MPPAAGTPAPPIAGLIDGSVTVHRRPDGSVTLQTRPAPGTTTTTGPLLEIGLAAADTRHLGDLLATPAPATGGAAGRSQPIPCHIGYRPGE